jgi:quinol monooxygenase YgiN
MTSPRVPPPLARIEQSIGDMVTATVRIVPSPNRRADVLEILRSVQGPVGTEPGCVACDIYDEQGPESAVVFIERWDTAEALDAHLRSETYRIILGAIELSDRRPDVRFEHVSATEGMELIERSRDAVGPPLRTGAGP